MSRKEYEAVRQRCETILAKLGRQWYANQIDPQDPDFLQLQQVAVDQWEDILEGYVKTQRLEWDEEDRRQIIDSQVLEAMDTRSGSLRDIAIIVC